MVSQRVLVILILAAAIVPGFARAADPAPPAAFNAIDADTLKSIIGKVTKSDVAIDATDPQGPILHVTMPGGLNYTVLMNDCDQGKPTLCLSLEFRASLPAGALNFSQINTFNEKMRYATAYLGDKGVPQLRMDENLRGGVTSNFVAYAVQIFIKLVAGYVQEAK